MDDADFSEAVDLGTVIGNSDIKILSVAGNGAKETVTDLLFARGIDVGIVQTDVLSALKQKPPFPDLEKFLQYITELYDQEIHILARNDIHSLKDLRDERVNFGTYESGTYTSASKIFEALGIPVQSTIYPQPLALEKLRRREIAATDLLRDGLPSEGPFTLRDSDRGGRRPLLRTDRRDVRGIGSSPGPGPRCDPGPHRGLLRGNATAHQHHL